MSPERWRPSSIRGDLPPTTWAYIAGIFDGEGNLIYTVSGWRVRISQVTSTGLCQWLMETTGAGALTVIRHQPEGRKPMLLWRCDRQADVLDFLLQVRPYVIVKREVAERALADLSALTFTQAARLQLSARLDSVGTVV